MRGAVAALAALASVFAGCGPASDPEPRTAASQPSSAPAVIERFAGPPVPEDDTALAAAVEQASEQALRPHRRPPSQHRDEDGDWDCRTSRQRCAAMAQAADRLAAVYPWQRLGWDLVVDDPSPALVGHTIPATRTVTLRPSATDPAHTEWLFAHEIGHAIWFGELDDRQRASYRLARGIGDHVPEHVDPPHRFDSVEEDYAEVFAWLTLGTDVRSAVAAPPEDPGELRAWFPPPP